MPRYNVHVHVILRICTLLQKLEKQGCLESIKQAVIESEYDVGMWHFLALIIIQHPLMSMYFLTFANIMRHLIRYLFRGSGFEKQW